MVSSIKKLLLYVSLFVTSFWCEALAGNERTFRVLFLDRPEGAPETLFLFDGKKSQEVELPSMNLSKVYELPSYCKKLILYPRPLKDSGSIPKGAAHVEVPRRGGDFYLLVKSDPKNSVSSIRVELVNAKLNKVDEGQMVWKNLTNYTVEGSLGKQKFSLQPMQETILKRPSDKREFISVEFSFIDEKGDRRSISASRWSYNPKHRSVGFIYKREKSRTPVVSNFLDFRVRR